MFALLLQLLACGGKVDTAAEYDLGYDDGCAAAEAEGAEAGREAGLACTPRNEAKRCGSPTYGVGYGRGYESCYDEAWEPAYTAAFEEAGC